ncbi:protein PAXX isoform X1 [Trachypithecus francoisi]|uniref:protein PAXX isoform X1 n=1 Tax=Trachypithecus francoisi TaxID=54180 RepID=UPI00141AC984|nr:protein PAXX isoform X1 [Trachypithecus francoisi]
MDPLSPPLCTLPPGPEPPRFVCYCEGEGSGEGEGGGFNLYVTDAAELWSTCFTPDSLAALKTRFGLSAAEDITPRFRAACEQQAVALTLQEDRASLTLSGGPSALAFDLSKVPGPEAASRLQALTLGLAKRVWSLERRLAAAEETAASPRKSPRPAGPQRFLPVRNQLVAWTLMRPEGAAQVWPHEESACEGTGSLRGLIRDPPTTTSTCLSWARTKAAPQVPSLSNKPLPLLEALVGL